GGGGQSRWRRGLIVAQVALSFILLSSGALVMRSFERLLRADPGFQSDGVFTVRVRAPYEFFPQMSDLNAFRDRLQRALAAIPGVIGAGAASALTLRATHGQGPITLPVGPGPNWEAHRDQSRTDLCGRLAYAFA